MFDEPQLKEKIQQLESEAIELESEMERFFILIDKKKHFVQKQPFPLTLYPPSSSFSDYEKFDIITGHLAKQHRSLIMHYEMWYNQAQNLIQNFYKDKEADFVRLHDGVRESYTGPAFKTGTGTVTKNITTVYGISELLQFDSSVRYSVNSSEELIQRITVLFSQQRAILLSLPKILPDIQNIPIKYKNDNNANIRDNTQIAEKSSLFPPHFKIALSFPGGYREKIQIIADGLVEELGQGSIFYDKYYEGELARINLDDTLQEIYRNKSNLIVVFFCSEYEKKEWCRLEWRAIKDLIKSRKDDAIMPIKLEDFDISELKGLFSFDGYLDIKDKEPDEIVNLIINRYRSMTDLEQN